MLSADWIERYAFISSFLRQEVIGRMMMTMMIKVAE